MEEAKKEVDEKKGQEGDSNNNNDAPVGFFWFLLFLLWGCFRDRSRDRFYEEQYNNNYYQDNY